MLARTCALAYTQEGPVPIKVKQLKLIVRLIKFLSGFKSTSEKVVKDTGNLSQQK